MTYGYLNPPQPVTATPQHFIPTLNLEIYVNASSMGCCSLAVDQSVASGRLLLCFTPTLLYLVLGGAHWWWAYAIRGFRDQSLVVLCSFRHC